MVQDAKATYDGPITGPWQAWASRDGAFVLMSQKDKESLDRKIGLKSDRTVIKDERH